MRRFAFAVTWAILGCGGRPPPETRTVTANDANGVPGGNRTGENLSGDYLITSISIENCTCRQGTCSMFHVQPGKTLTIVEYDGALVVTGDDGEVSKGGVNTDGTFSFGGRTSIPATYGQGQIDSITSGSFEVSGGVPTGMQFQVEQTITGTPAGTAYDCDLALQAISRYEGGGPASMTTHALPGASSLALTAGTCTVVNAVPQMLPALSTVSFTVTDHTGNDEFIAGVVDSGKRCDGATTGLYGEALGTGSVTTGSQSGVPAGSYDLEIICFNTIDDCLIDAASWSATY